VQGEYIAPEKIEAVYSRSPLVGQAFVYGDSLKAQLVAVVHPDPDALLPWAAERGMGASVEALCKDAAVAAAVLRSMQQEGAAAQLKGFEQVRAPGPSRPSCDTSLHAAVQRHLVMRTYTRRGVTERHVRARAGVCCAPDAGALLRRQRPAHAELQAQAAAGKGRVRARARGAVPPPRRRADMRAGVVQVRGLDVRLRVLRRSAAAST
jgi:AMP-binding enzyme C-terminal domain